MRRQAERRLDADRRPGCFSMRAAVNRAEAVERSSARVIADRPLQCRWACSTNIKQQQRREVRPCATQDGARRGSKPCRCRPGFRPLSRWRGTAPRDTGRERARGPAMPRIEFGHDCAACIPAIAHSDRIEKKFSRQPSRDPVLARRLLPGIRQIIIKRLRHIMIKVTSEAPGRRSKTQAIVGVCWMTACRRNVLSALN
jgi:hypothetical protein